MTQRPRILVVDDEESMRNFVACALDAAGYEVVGASNGADALECVERHPPFDLFVVDMLMPQMEGDELSRRLHRRDPDAKVLFLTGHSDRLFAQRQVLWENEAFLDKPVSVDGLLEGVALLLNGRLAR